MKTRISKWQSLLPILLIALALVAGCSAFMPRHPNPLAGWHTASKNPSQSIIDDYQNYIRTLSPEEQKNAGPILFFADGNGQHAIDIEIGINGKSWKHILIYDEDDKRIKVIKYFAGRYAS